MRVPVWTNHFTAYIGEHLITKPAAVESHAVLADCANEFLL